MKGCHWLLDENITDLDYDDDNDDDEDEDNIDDDDDDDDSEDEDEAMWLVNPMTWSRLAQWGVELPTMARQQK